MDERNNPLRNKIPDLNDMFVAGLELRDAVALEREIVACPEADSAEWWAKIDALQCSPLP